MEPAVRIKDDDSTPWLIDAPQSGNHNKVLRHGPWNANAKKPDEGASVRRIYARPQTASSSVADDSSPHRQTRPFLPTASDNASLDVQLREATISDHNHGTGQSVHTQLSTSLSQKRTAGDDIQGPPRKQPFSPSMPHAVRAPTQDSVIDHRRQLPEVLSPAPTSPDIRGHYQVQTSSLHPYEKYPPSSPASAPPAELPIEAQLVKQPQTRPITENQLINEVKGIYAGLVMVEKKCVEIVAQQSQSTKRLSDQQWKALVALHRTLLQEHHDFFSASQHPTASETLKKLAIKYAMPARMWRHGIHAFLELLRHRLPDSMEHMLSFIYLAYSMMALLKESVPNFVETWIECLGDLARYRMAIEDIDPRDREIWSNVAKMWYNEAADKSPMVGRIQHHLAVLARPNIVEQLFYYGKALVSVVPFVNARESIMLLFDMFLKNSDAVQTRYPLAEYSFVNTYAMLFTRRNPAECGRMLEMFKSSFGGHLDRAAARFKVQGPQMASALFAGLMDFGKEDAYVWRLYCQQMEDVEVRKKAPERLAEQPPMSETQSMLVAQRNHWADLRPDAPVKRIPPPQSIRDQEVLETSEAVVTVAASLTFKNIDMVASRMGDRNGIPFMHVVLANLFDWSFVPGALTYIESCIPWKSIVSFLNTVAATSRVSFTNVEADTFPPSEGGHGKQLPEDFLMRGMMSTKHYYEPNFFSGPLVDEDERTIELPSHQVPRAERCLWLGVRLAKLGRYFNYDCAKHSFRETELVQSLAATYV